MDPSISKSKFPGVFVQDGKKMICGGMLSSSLIVYDILNDKII
jgi:hypothetical protein